ncbi:MAG TPA: RecX family transcriptional regulator, partial [Ktedonobacteraceae bacterium]|nr:RecX family transcriptional regulator [Ktedonobacteraceae bacterium]
KPQPPYESRIALLTVTWYSRPMKITAIEPQVRDTERVNVFVDGRFLLGVKAELLKQMGLEVEQELSPAQLEQLRYEEALQQAVERAYNFLSYRPRSREEVRRYLRRKETPTQVIDAALAKLDRLDLVNDEAFTSFWVENREQFSPRGARALKNELRMKGVERAVVDEMITGDNDEELALKAGRKKALSLLRIPEIDFATFRNRLGSFLQRRGFGYDVTKRTVSALWHELRPNEDADYS